jgi:RuvB-like protein 2
MAHETSLRYSLNLIAPSHLLAQRRKSPVVEVVDVKLAYKYFIDVQRSADYAAAMSGMMFGEEEVGAEKANGNGLANGGGNGMAMDTSA